MNIEQVIIEYLGSKLSVPVYADVPIDKNKSGDESLMTFVTVERTGGNHDNKVLDHPSIAVQSWSDTRFNASDLSLEVDKILLEIYKDVNEIVKIERDNLYNFPDLNSQSPRYQGIYQITIYI